MARSKNHKPGLSPGVGLTFTPSNDAMYTESFNDYLKKRNINRNQAIGELITIALQALKDSYDLPDPTVIQYMDNRVPIYPSPNLSDLANIQVKPVTENNVDIQHSSVLKEDESSIDDHPLDSNIENKRQKVLDFINTPSDPNGKEHPLNQYDERSKSEQENESSKTEKKPDDSSKTNIHSLASMLKGME